MIPYNDADSARRIIRSHRDDIAAVLIEPICFNTGTLLPKKGFLEELREVTSELDIPLIFDEIITGFRLAPGGAQRSSASSRTSRPSARRWGTASRSSAITGKADLINLSKPGGKVAYAGTYNGNQMSAAASLATLDVLKDGSVQRYLAQCTKFSTRESRDWGRDASTASASRGSVGSSRSSSRRASSRITGRRSRRTRRRMGRSGRR